MEMRVEETVRPNSTQTQAQEQRGMEEEEEKEEAEYNNNNNNKMGPNDRNILFAHFFLVFFCVSFLFFLVI